jgi:hypothetical protein
MALGESSLCKPLAAVSVTSPANLLSGDLYNGSDPPGFFLALRCPSPTAAREGGGDPQGGGRCRRIRNRRTAARRNSHAELPVNPALGRALVRSLL